MNPEEVNRIGTKGGKMTFIKILGKDERFRAVEFIIRILMEANWRSSMSSRILSEEGRAKETVYI